MKDSGGDPDDEGYDQELVYDPIDNSRRGYDVAINTLRLHPSVVLEYAAFMLESGLWEWYANVSHSDWKAGGNCALTAITEAARELGAITAAYPAVAAMQRVVGEIGPFNDQKGQTVEGVVAALRAAAMLA